MKIRIPILQNNIHLTSAKRKLALVSFTVLCAFIFLNFFEPFGIYHNPNNSKEAVFIELSIATALAFVVLLLSQFVVRVLLSLHKFSTVSIIAWFFIETIFVALTWSFFEIISQESNPSFFTILFENILAYIFIMGLPYFGFIIFISVKDTIYKLKKKENTQIINTPLTISIPDEKGNVKLVIRTENLLFLKSSDNYIEIHYIDNTVVKKALIRNSIKKISPILGNSSIMRCHRSYMVNTNKISVISKTTAGYTITLVQLPNTKIPVSKTHISEFKTHTQTILS